MEPTRAIRMLVSAAVVIALAVLVTSPAQARWQNEGGGGAAAALPSAGNPGDSAWIAAERAGAGQTVGNPGDGSFVAAERTAAETRIVGNAGDGAAVTPIRHDAVVGASDTGGVDTALLGALAGGALLLLSGAGAIVVTARHRRVALP